MTVLQLELQVRDYETWKRTFDDDPADRVGKGVRRHRILRSTDDPNAVLVHLEFGGSEDAQRMRDALVALWEEMGSDVFDSATARVMEEVEAKDYQRD
jgi:hypothetical protein